MGPANETHDGKPLPMMIEPWPGGRWFRDLGDDNGHLWGHVQAIKRPTLLEITGRCSCRIAVVSNLQYRLKEVDGGTLITFRHTALGFIPDDYSGGLTQGWTPLLERSRSSRSVIGTNRRTEGRSWRLIESCCRSSNRKRRRRGVCSSACPEISWRGKPHEKSMSLGQLALHVATVPGGVAEICRRSRRRRRRIHSDRAPNERRGAAPGARRRASPGRRVLGGMDDAALMADLAADARRSRVVGAAARRRCCARSC